MWGLIALVIVILLEASSSGHSSSPPAPPVHKAVVVHHPSFTAQTDAAISHTLSHTPYITLGQAHKREIALTFDDGPGPYTPQILAVLKRMHVHGTFFEVGREVKQFGANTKALADADEAIEDHTEDHSNLSQLSPGQQRDQVVDASKAIVAAGAPAPRLFRPPYGAFNHKTLAMLKGQGLLMVMWSVDTSDYARPGVPRIVSAALNGAHPGGIILMHDGGGDRSETVQALPQIIQRPAPARLLDGHRAAPGARRSAAAPPAAADAADRLHHVAGSGPDGARDVDLGAAGGGRPADAQPARDAERVDGPVRPAS